MPNYTAYQPDYGGLGEGDYGSAGLGGGSATGLGMSDVMPYLQALLGVYGATRGDSGTQQLADKFSSMMGADANLPSQPSSQSKSNRAMRAGGEAALNFVPVVGGALSAVGGAYNADVDARAKQQYLQKLLSSNPGMVDPGGIGLQSEYVPQNNAAARYAQSRPQYEQNIIEKNLYPQTKKLYDKLGGVGKFAGQTDALFRLGKNVIGSKQKQQDREDQIRHENMQKAKAAEESQNVAAQDATVRKRSAQAMGGSGMSPQAHFGAMQSILQQILAPQGWQALGRGFGGQQMTPQPAPQIQQTQMPPLQFQQQPPAWRGGY